MRYKTCASVAEKTPKRLKQTLTKALKKSDYAEIRFDFLNPNLVPDALQQIKKDLRKCVCTLRPVSEGGKFEGGEKIEFQL
uniref:3-dehydroquinate dehydratase (AroD) n=1 Tax=uncultured marine thaumarchaeote SAT1000_05_G10 TaxID=1456358 RepID=A0A075I6W8_9ARCH|nr:3-dehydroquinate dehydratase (aroD) [uncultured marine thaumarchaeote SAT1000_05_G10]